MAVDKKVVIKNAVDKLFDTFVKGTFSQQVAMSIIRKHSDDVIPSDKWSLGNRVLTLIQCDNIDARGYNQWLQVNRKVKKGSKAVYIFAPLIAKKTVQKQGTNEAEEYSFCYGFRLIPVFSVNDTEGEPLPTLDYIPKTFPPFFNVTKSLGIEVAYKGKLDTSSYGSFNSKNNSIELNSHDIVVYYHELAHAIHNTFAKLSEIDKERKEIVAEFSAIVLCELSGVHGYESQAYEYIKHYCHESEPEKVLKKIMQVFSDVEKIVEIVLKTSEIIK